MDLFPIVLQELQKILKGVPEISQLVGAAVVDQLLNITPEDEEGAVKAALKQLFTQIMSASEHVIAEVLSQLIPRLRKKDAVCYFWVFTSFCGALSLQMINGRYISLLMFAVHHVLD